MSFAALWSAVFSRKGAAKSAKRRPPLPIDPKPVPSPLRSPSTTNLRAWRNVLIFSLFAAIFAAVVSIHNSDWGNIDYDSYTLASSDVPGYMKLSRKKIKTGAACRTFGTADDVYFERFAGTTCSFSQWTNRQSGPIGIKDINITQKYFKTDQNASNYTWRFWGIHVQEPLPLSVYRNETLNAPLIGCLLGDDVKVFMWDPTRFMQPNQAHKSTEYNFKHIVYSNRIDNMFMNIHVSGDPSISTEFVASLVAKIYANIETHRPSKFAAKVKYYDDLVFSGLERVNELLYISLVLQVTLDLAAFSLQYAWIVLSVVALCWSRDPLRDLYHSYKLKRAQQAKKQPAAPAPSVVTAPPPTSGSDISTPTSNRRKPVKALTGKMQPVIEKAPPQSPAPTQLQPPSHSVKLKDPPKPTSTTAPAAVKPKDKPAPPTTKKHVPPTSAPAAFITSTPTPIHAPAPAPAPAPAAPSVAAAADDSGFSSVKSRKKLKSVAEDEVPTHKPADTPQPKPRAAPRTAASVQTTPAAAFTPPKLPDILLGLRPIGGVAPSEDFAKLPKTTLYPPQLDPPALPPAVPAALAATPAVETAEFDLSPSTPLAKAAPQPVQPAADATDTSSKPKQPLSYVAAAKSRLPPRLEPLVINQDISTFSPPEVATPTESLENSPRRQRLSSQSDRSTSGLLSPTATSSRNKRRSRRFSDSSSPPRAAESSSADGNFAVPGSFTPIPPLGVEYPVGVAYLSNSYGTVAPSAYFVQVPGGFLWLSLFNDQQQPQPQFVIPPLPSSDTAAAAAAFWAATNSASS